MRLDILDSTSQFNNPLYRIPAGVKLAFALLMLLAINLIPASHQWGQIILFMILSVIVVISRIPPGILAVRLLLFEPFVIGVSVLSLLQPNGVTIFLRLVIRGTLCLFTVILLSYSTPFLEILNVLKRLKLPMILVTILALMHRYLFVLWEEAIRMKRARASRTFQRSRIGLWGITASVIGQLFIHAVERAGRIYAAMCARGWKT